MIETILLITALFLTTLLVIGNTSTRKADYIMPDCIDIQCEIQPLPFSDLSKAQRGEPSVAIRERVIATRKIQEKRFEGVKGIYCNAQMTERMIHQYVQPDEESLHTLRQAMESLSLCQSLQPHTENGAYHS